MLSSRDKALTAPVEVNVFEPQAARAHRIDATEVRERAKAQLQYRE